MKTKEMIKWLTPPVLSQLARRLVRSAAANGRPREEWEYVPEGWSRQTKDRAIKGWNDVSVLEVYRKRWADFVGGLEGTGPLGLSPESPSRERHNLVFHNIVMSYAYALTLAARKKEKISMLDWGGGIGHFYLLSRTLIPDLEIDYHCNDMPIFVDHGQALLPDAHFFADQERLQGSYDFVLASGSLHYSENWRNTLRDLAKMASGFLFVASAPVVEMSGSFVFVQRPYSFGYNTEYLGWCLNRQEFLQAARDSGLSLIREFVVGHRPFIHRAPEQNEYRSFLFRPQAEEKSGS